jgi:hypothetical protein
MPSAEWNLPYFEEAGSIDNLAALFNAWTDALDASLTAVLTNDYFFGSRPLAPVDAGTARQGYITGTWSSRGITRAGTNLVFDTPGIYKIDQAVVWSAHPSGQRNLGIQGVGITALGPEEAYDAVSTTIQVSQSFSSYILVDAAGSTAQPYVTHNSGAVLDVSGSVSIMRVST